MRLFGSAALATVSVLVSAQSNRLEHFIGADGVDLGPVARVTGAQTNPAFKDNALEGQMPGRDRVRVSWTPSASPSFNEFVKSLARLPSSQGPKALSIVSAPNLDEFRFSGRRLFAYWPHMHQLTTPGISPFSDPGLFEAEFSFKDIAIQRGNAPRPVRQRPWLTPNFKLDLGKLPANTVIGTGPSVTTLTYSDDDTAPPMVTLEEFTFYVPWYAAQPFSDASKPDASGLLPEIPLTYTITDGGQATMTLTSVVNVEVVEDVALFAADGYPGVYRVKVKEPKYFNGHVTLIK